MASRGPPHQGVVRWAGSGGWFDESVMSFLGCLILGLPYLLFAGVFDVPFANVYNRSIMLSCR
jgi:hypothetical protein